ncbi:RHS repeat-associated core domain-containing protein, partial [Arenibacter sp. GZD96]|uniref:RHS repeat domain-containing protein n=1 Tax=Aurantibrevibacter litoralis TaxID=3106030 RepID=UPI002AFDCA99
MGATYIGGDGYSAPVVWRSEQATTTLEDYYFLHRDYLGSILMISDKNGNIREKRHFDAWGNIAKLTDGNNTVLTSFALLDRGYTGHEHLLSVGLVHMNGRLYDPVLHRFLMPDNYVQDPYNTQNFNRYGYVLNNP